MSLRTRVIAAVSLIGIALAVMLVFVTRTTEAGMVRQVDEQLAGAVQPVRDAAFPHDRDQSHEGEPRPRPPHDDGFALSSLFVGYLDGDQVETVAAPGLRADVPLPEITGEQARAGAESGEPFTVAGASGDVRYRVLASSRDGGDTAVIVAAPLDSVDAATSDLVRREVAGATVIVAALVLVAIWVIRLGVRPVKQMTEVATAVAAGDLSQRVPAHDPRTEAGELGEALNQMMTSIEQSFAERERSQERLRQFVADASHELRTPVATIRGYAELYRTGGLVSDQALADAMRRTEAEAVRMGGLVDDLLALARLDEGLPLQLGPVDLATVLADASDDARAVDPSRSIEVEVPAGLMVQADEARVRQILANLVGNALVHTPAGTPITLRAGRTDDVCSVEVADQGPGMSAEAAERAFERFYRADPSRARHQGGTGLGLAIVEATVRAHGGTVTLRSVPGSGTTVRIELPASR